VQLLTAPFAIVADAVSFLGSAFFLRRVHVAEPPTEEVGRGHLAGGIRFIVRTPLMRATLATTATINLCTFAFFSLFVLYVTRELDVRPGVLGLVLAVGAAGGVAGAVVAGSLTRRIGLGPVFVLGSVLVPAPLLLVPAAGGS